MHIKSLALVAAAVMTAGAAQAADLNKPAKVAVDYVKVCDAYGAGFFYIPGSDTCLKISGFARLDLVTGGQSKSTIFGGQVYNGQPSRTVNAFETRVRGDVTFDARTNTSYGLLRSFIEAHSNLGTSAGNASRTVVELDNAFVQLGGLTAGRTTSKYNFADAEQANQEYQFEAFLDNSVNLLAYTFSFGNGITATLSLEDPTTAGYQSTNSGAANSSVRRYNTGASFTYGALNAPDVIGNINVTQAWGEAQVAVAAHQVYGSVASPATKEGFGIFGGVLFNVPQLGAGDTIGVEGGYGLGSVGYVQSYSAQGADVGVDASYVNGSLKLSNAWSIGAVLNHNFAPNAVLHLSANYMGWSNTVYTGGLVAGSATGKANLGDTEFSAQLDWQPVKNFHVMPDVEVRSVSLNNAAKANTALYNGVAGANTSGTAYVFGVRIQRNF